MSDPNVFISHNSKDKEIAREVAMFLVAEDISVWFDEWEISVGDSIVAEIETGLRNCSHLILIWSDNAESSPWVRKELRGQMTEAIETGEPMIIPVLLDDTSLPELLGDIKYHEWNGGSEADRRTLINGILGHAPENTYTQAVVKRYKELVRTDPGEYDPVPFKACPDCGSKRLDSRSGHAGRGIWVAVKECQDCGWMAGDEL